MPNILDLPMKKVTQLVVNDRECIGEFTAKRAKITVKSTAKSGITIQSKYKSESMLVGINDNYLASVLYRRRTFPIWIVLSVFSALIGLLAFTDDDTLVMAGAVGWFFCFLFMILFFTSRTARIIFRLADEQDYQILFTSGAVQNTELMSQFINRILMNSMNHFVDEAIPEVAEATPQLNKPLATLPTVSNEDTLVGASAPTPLRTPAPPASAEAHAKDENGFEWITTPNGDAFFRPIDSGADWMPHQG